MTTPNRPSSSTALVAGFAALAAIFACGCATPSLSRAVVEKHAVIRKPETEIAVEPPVVAPGEVGDYYAEIIIDLPATLECEVEPPEPPVLFSKTGLPVTLRATAFDAQGRAYDFSPSDCGELDDGYYLVLAQSREAAPIESGTSVTAIRFASSYTFYAQGVIWRSARR